MQISTKKENSAVSHRRRAHRVFSKLFSVLLAILMLMPVLEINRNEVAEGKSYRDISVGDHITLGVYDGKLITWVCAAIDDNGPLMLSEYVLCSKEYDAAGENGTYHADSWGYIRKEKGSNCWQDSNIRQWLNTKGAVNYTHCPPSYAAEPGFLSYFTDEELQYVKTVSHTVIVVTYDSQRPGYCDGGSKDRVSDDIYSPSFNINNYYHKTLTDTFMLLDPAQINNIYLTNQNILECGGDWLTCAVNGNNNACFELINGFESNATRLTQWDASARHGIRPAFYLNTETVVENSYGDVSVGDRITLGVYNGIPITWVCAAIDDNGPLMLSENVLCSKEYDAAGENGTYHADSWGSIRKNKGSNCWQDSNIRQWLNTKGAVDYTHCPPSYEEETGFLSCFTEKELRYVKTVSHTVIVVTYDSQRPGYCDGGSKDRVSDDIYSPSFNINKYYHKTLTDTFMLLDPAQVNNIYLTNQDILECGDDWLTCAVNGNNNACFELINGFESNASRLTQWDASARHGIRPAFYLNTESNTGPFEDNGIRVTVFSSSDQIYLKKNRLLCDADGNQLNKFSVNVLVENVSNRMLEEKGILLELSSSVSHDPSLKKILNRTIFIDRGSSDVFSVEWTPEELWNAFLYKDGSIKLDLTFGLVAMKVDPIPVMLIADTPEHYDCFRDKLSFKNQTSPIGIDKYIDCFGDLPGIVLYDWDFFWDRLTVPGTGGQCHGMAAVTGLLLNNPGLSGEYEIRQLEKDYIFSEFTTSEYTTSLSKLISYAYIMQDDFDCVKTLDENKGKIDDLYRAVQDFADGGDPVLIKISGASGKHAVLGVGIAEDTAEKVTILLDDSNYNEGPLRSRRYLTLFRRDGTFTGAWEFRPKDDELWTSSGFNVYLSYMRIDDSIFNKLKNVTTNHNDPSKTIKNVLRTNHPEILNKGLLYRLDPARSAEPSDSSAQDNLYWVDNDTQTFSVTAAGNSFYELISASSAVKATANDGNTVSLAAGENTTDRISVSGNTSDPVELTFTALDGNGEIYRTTISGTINASAAQAVASSDGYQVSGLDHMTIVLANEEGAVLSSAAADITDGREVNITVDQPNSAVSTDFTEETPEEPTTPPDEPTTPPAPSDQTDSLCKYCHQDHGNSFWGRIVAFFHRILYFFAHLFGKM